jgi:thiol-disulfide isomerase/thioredoxin
MTFRCAAVALALAGGLACARSSIPANVPEKEGAAPSASARTGEAPSGAQPQLTTPWRLVPRPRVEPQAPPSVPPAEIRFTDLAGVRDEVDALRARGRPVLVNFWATWCGACVHELPLLGNLAREWGEDGPAILGVSLDRLTVDKDDPVLDRVRTMLATHGVSYPNCIVRGDQQQVYDAYEISTGIPVSVFYDDHGVVVRRFIGPVRIEEARAVARSLAAGG